MKLTSILVGAAIASGLAGCAMIPTPDGPAVVPLLAAPIGWYQPVPIAPIYPEFDLLLPPPMVIRGPYGLPEPVPSFPPSPWW